MADEKTVRDDAPKTEPHPADQVAAVCVDVIDLGMTVEQFQNNQPEIKEKVVLVFRTEAKRDGKHLHIAQEFTASMGKKANLRKFLEAWRGTPYTEDEAKKQGIPLHKLVGIAALLTVAHRVSGAGNTYAFIQTITKLPRAMKDSAPPTDAYERAGFWSDRKAEYQAKAEKFLAAHPMPGSTAAPARDDFSDQSEEDSEGDALPF